MHALAAICSWLLGAHAYAADDNLQNIQRGQFDITLSLDQLLEPETIESMAKAISADEDITWKMYVPENYDPGKPAGLMVYISPTPKGWMPRNWQSVIDEENLIWISANDSGNRTIDARRILFAVLGTQIAAKNYAIDTDRVYLSGFSGGGKVASKVAIDFANLFKGAIYICGVLHWKRNPPPLYDQVKANRYVFLTGKNDFNSDLTKNIYRKYQSAGLRNIYLMDILGMAHKTPGTKDFRKAISYLDERE
jgi:hypothetical protein